MRLWGRAAFVVFDLWLLVALGRGLVGTREHVVRDVVLLLLVIGGVVAVGCLWLVLRARRRAYDLHEHGLVLRGRDEDDVVVLPWATVDPGRVILSSPPRAVQSWTPRGILDWAARPPTVLVNGWGHLPAGREELASSHRCDTGGHGTPFGWWLLPVTDPADLLTRIEAAMLADGHPAKGLAATTLERRYGAGEPTRAAVRELERDASDPAIGLAKD